MTLIGINLIIMIEFKKIAMIAQNYVRYALNGHIFVLPLQQD